MPARGAGRTATPNVPEALHAIEEACGKNRFEHTRLVVALDALDDALLRSLPDDGHREPVAGVDHRAPQARIGGDPPQVFANRLDARVVPVGIGD